MASYIHAFAASGPEWALYVVSLLVSVLPDGLLLVQRRGFGRGGVGFGRRRGSFGLFRILFALLFTTLLGPIVLVALVAFVAYRFFASRRRGWPDFSLRARGTHPEHRRPIPRDVGQGVARATLEQAEELKRVLEELGELLGE
jgi:hypothetical protein